MFYGLYLATGSKDFFVPLSQDRGGKMTQKFDSWLCGASTKYTQARELIEKESLLDPSTRPYKSKYEAQEIFQKLLDELSEQNYEDFIDDSDPLNQVNMMKITLRYELGVVSIETDETGRGQKFLESATSLLSELLPGCHSLVLFRVNISNQIGFLLCLFGDHEKAGQFFRDAEKAAIEWRAEFDNRNKSGQKLPTYDFGDSFSPSLSNQGFDEETLKKVDKAHTQTLYYLAQVYEKLGRNAEAASYCNQTLRRQYASGEFDAIDWAINAATLAQYFASNDYFGTARHHLEAAHFVLENHNCDFGDEDERLKKAKADLSRILTKYCLFLFECLEAKNQDDNLFALLNEAIVAKDSAWKNIPVSPPKTFDDAKVIFLTATKALENAKEYYSLDEHASDNVECVRDNSKIYQLLSRFEIDNERVCKMHKRRVDMLENLVKELSLNYFLSQCRQILFELAETYSEMVDLKLASLELKRSRSVEELKVASTKVNSMIHKAIKHFRTFIDSFREKSNNQLPATFPDEMVKPVLVAYLSMGRLTTKLLTSDPREQIKNWTACEDSYKRAIKYIGDNPDHEQFVIEEIALIREMLTLIPGKLNMFLNSTMY